MNNEWTMSQRILRHYDEMPRGERRLADLLLENGSAMRRDTATSLAAGAGISKATAARFFKRLGYSCFKDAQREARENAVSVRRAPPGRPTEPSLRPKISLSHHLENEIRNLVATIEQQRTEELDEAIGLLARGDKLWVVGFGDNYPLAHFARALLIKQRSDIRMIPIGGFSVPEEFASITSSDVMLAFGIGRRTRTLRNILASASRAEARVILVTDQVSGRDAANATVVLRTRTTGGSLFDSMTSTVSLLTYLFAALVDRIGDRAIHRLELIDTIHAEWGDLLEPDR